MNIYREIQHKYWTENTSVNNAAKVFHFQSTGK